MARSPSQLAETLGGLGRLTELRQRLLFVFVALIIYRIGTFIPVPGVNPQALLQFMNSQQGTIVDVFNLFTGGALERFSLFALGRPATIPAKMISEIPFPTPRSVICSPSHFCFQPGDLPINAGYLVQWIGGSELVDGRFSSADSRQPGVHHFIFIADYILLFFLHRYGVQLEGNGG